MTSTYKITIKRQLYFLSYSIIIISFIVGIFYYAFGFTPATIFTSTFTFIFCLPTFILHTQYLIKNWNSTLTIDRNSNYITYRKSDVTLKYSFDCIQNITKTKSSISYIYTYPHDDYFYYRILFKDGVELIISCLLADDLESVFTLIFHKTINIKKMAIPFIKNKSTANKNIAVSGAETAQHQQ